MIEEVPRVSYSITEKTHVYTYKCMYISKSEFRRYFLTRGNKFY